MHVVHVTLVLFRKVKHIRGEQCEEGHLTIGHCDLTLLLIVTLVYDKAFILHSFKKSLGIGNVLSGSHGHDLIAVLILGIFLKLLFGFLDDGEDLSKALIVALLRGSLLA